MAELSRHVERFGGTGQVRIGQVAARRNGRLAAT